MTFLLLLGLLVSAAHICAAEKQTTEVPIVLPEGIEQEDLTNPLFAFYIPLAHFNICFHIPPLLQTLSAEQTQKILNILTPEEIHCLLSWCTIAWHNQTNQTLYAPQLLERQKFIAVADKIDEAGIQIDELGLYVPLNKEHHAGTLKVMFARNFEVVRYSMMYATLQQECSADEALILHTLFTPTQFAEQMSLHFEELPVPLLFPTYYSPESLQDENLAIIQSLDAALLPLTTKQKLFLLLESNLRSTLTLECIFAVHREAFNALKIEPTATIMMPENIDPTALTLETFPYDNTMLMIPFEALYAKAQELSATGTAQEKALFQLQATPEDYVTHVTSFVPQQITEENK